MIRWKDFIFIGEEIGKWNRYLDWEIQGKRVGLLEDIGWSKA